LRFSSILFSITPILSHDKNEQTNTEKLGSFGQRPVGWSSSSGSTDQGSRSMGGARWCHAFGCDPPSPQKRPGSLKGREETEYDAAIDDRAQRVAPVAMP
jgi:hypothetical protein